MKLYYAPSNTGIVTALVLICIQIACIVGWCMNLQNLWQYWPADGIMHAGMQWVLSLIGVFVFPMGVVTGYLW